jgi:hypothetical protein
MKGLITMNPLEEFDRQTSTLIQKGYPEITGMQPDTFRSRLEPLKRHLHQLTLPEIDLEQGQLPFVIVIKSPFVPTKTAMSLVNKNDKTGVVKLFPLEPEDFSTLDEVTIPEGSAYLITDIDRGKANISRPPAEAMQLIKQAGRSPLTIDEGVAIMTQFPEFLIKNNCFSLLASRHSGDTRVPAIWINGNKNPNLGWCWNGNPHTWLGSASCQTRIGS